MCFQDQYFSGWSLVRHSKSLFTCKDHEAALGLFVFAAISGENTIETTSVPCDHIPDSGEKTF
jgi:hypothetical protein